MFTGIVEGLRTVVGVDAGPGWTKIRVDLGESAAGVRLGDSVAIDGCCLTVEGLVGTVAGFHLLGETVQRTTFGALRSGSLVNVERSLKVGDQLGGHFVSGHVDGTAPVVSKVEAPDQTVLAVDLPADLADLVVMKGSITFDGVSLTVMGLDGARVSVALIPHTLAITTLGSKGVGARVNVEVDMIGKWVRQFVPRSTP